MVNSRASKLVRAAAVILLALALVLGTFIILDRQPDMANGIFMFVGGASFVGTGRGLLNAPRVGWRLVGSAILLFGLFMAGCGTLLTISSF